MVPIVICTVPTRNNWLLDCLSSINREVVVLSDFTNELGKISWMVKNTNFDRFLFLQDSVVIKNDLFFDKMFAHDGSVSVNQCPKKYGSFMGIWERKVLLETGIPVAKNRKEVIDLEFNWTPKYCAAAGSVPVVFPELHDYNASEIVMRHGRKNLVLENDYIVKYKGTWA